MKPPVAISHLIRARSDSLLLLHVRVHRSGHVPRAAAARLHAHAGLVASGLQHGVHHLLVLWCSKQGDTEV